MLHKINKLKRHLATHKPCLGIALALVALSVFVTSQVMSAAPVQDVAQRGETIAVMSSFYPQGEFTVLQGSALESPLLYDCPNVPEGGLTFVADTNAFSTIPGSAGERGGASNTIPFKFSKPVQTGTRLGEFSRPMSCGGSYAYTATVLN